MKLTNWQVYNFINIVTRPTKKQLDGAVVFAVAMTKHALSPIYDSIIEAQKSIAETAPKPLPEDAGDDEREEHMRLTEEANQRFVEVLNTEVEVPHVPELSVESLYDFTRSLQEAEFMLFLPFVKENLLEARNDDNTPVPA